MCMRLLRLAIVSLVLATACGTSSDVAAPDRADRPREGSPTRSPRAPDAPTEVSNPAPDFAFETFEGETFRLSEHRGTPIVLNFWESW